MGQAQQISLRYTVLLPGLFVLSSPPSSPAAADLRPRPQPSPLRRPRPPHVHPRPQPSIRVLVRSCRSAYSPVAGRISVLAQPLLSSVAHGRCRGLRRIVAAEVRTDLVHAVKRQRSKLVFYFSIVDLYSCIVVDEFLQTLDLLLCVDEFLQTLDLYT
jgi:hypothetical protein